MSDIVPFQILGNLYFVGEYRASCHLIDTGNGLILIDTGYVDGAETVMESIRTLGFRVEDIRIILHSHGHYDHTGATPAIVAVSGAETYLNSADFRYIEGFTPDHDLRDGDVITLGNTSIHVVETPGHTLGTVSFFWDIREGGKTYRAGMFGGAGTKQLTKPYLDKLGLFYLQRGDFFRSIEKMKREKVDVFVGNHVWHMHTDRQAEELRRNPAGANPFINPDLWVPFLEMTEETMRSIIQKESEELFVNYAHRGASSYAPENTMMAFYLGLSMHANGIETDVQRTKDGKLVLFHDDTLERVTGAEGSVCDYDYEELAKLWVRNDEWTDDLCDRIVLLEDFFAHFCAFPITFAIELKNPGYEEETYRLICKYGVEKKCVVTSFNLRALENMRQVAPELKLGYLTSSTDTGKLKRLREYGIDQFCIYSGKVTAENVRLWHEMGFNVRTWGVKNETVMEACCRAGVDGMTVNFPDRLEHFLREEKLNTER